MNNLSMSPHKVANAYYMYGQLGIPNHDIMLEVFRCILRNLTLAKQAYLDGKLDNMCTHTQKNFPILLVLQDMLEVDASDPNAGEALAITNYLKWVYRTALTRLVNILQEPSPEAEFSRQIEQFRLIYDAWKSSRADQSASPVTNTAIA